MRFHRLIAACAALFVAASSLAVPAFAADLTITAASVLPGSGARYDRQHVAGETLTAGQAVYLASTGKWLKADSDSATAAVRQASGVTLGGGGLDQPIVVQTGGSITLGATLTAGASYYLSNTAGGIMPAADLSTGEYVDLICLATSTSVCALNFFYTGVVTP